MNRPADCISIVLVEPQSPGNIGMVCRAMKNMGLKRLRLVNGCDRFHSESLKFAVAARDLLEGAEVFPDLSSAIADCTLTAGTTRRHGKYRREILAPQQLADIFREQAGPACQAAIVFGREDSGLTTDELAMCRFHTTIPAAEEYGSLNLSQAVLIFCYELCRAGEFSLSGRKDPAATSVEMESMFIQMNDCLQKIGFLNEQNPGHIMRSMRRIFFRSDLDSREVSILRGMLTQIDWASSGFDGRKRP